MLSNRHDRSQQNPTYGAQALMAADYFGNRWTERIIKLHESSTGRVCNQIVVPEITQYLNFWVEVASKCSSGYEAPTIPTSAFGSDRSLSC